MPEASQSHADMHVIEPQVTRDASLQELEEKIRLAVETIEHLRRERAALRRELEQAQERIALLEADQTQSHSHVKELQALTSERDRLLQDRRVAAGRVEGMLNRLKDLGFE